MPKVSTAGKFRKAAAKQKAETNAHQDGGSDGTSAARGMSRGQRKRQAKREQYLKREKMILSTLQLKRQEEQKKRLDGLDALKAALSTVGASESSTDIATAPCTQKPMSSTTLKGKKRLAARETEHMNLVLQHPAFKSNPFEAIQQHLRNSLSGQAKDQEQKSKERAKAEQQREETKKKEKKERIQASGGRHRKKFHAARRT